MSGRHSRHHGIDILCLDDLILIIFTASLTEPPPLVRRSNIRLLAPRFTDEMDRLSEKYLLLENHLAIGNFGGFPSITIPSGIIDDMPVAINITGPIKTDDVVCNIANKLEEKIGFVPLSVKEEN